MLNFLCDSGCYLLSLWIFHRKLCCWRKKSKSQTEPFFISNQGMWIAFDPPHALDNHKSSWGISVEDKVVDIVSILLSWCSVDIHGTGHCWTMVEPPNMPNQWSTRPSMHPAHSAAQPILPPPLCPDLWGQCAAPLSPSPACLLPYCSLWEWVFKINGRDEHTVRRGKHSLVVSIISTWKWWECIPVFLVLLIQSLWHQ